MITAQQMRKQLEKAIQEMQWQATWHKEEEKLSIDILHADKPFDISIPQTMSRMKRENIAPEKMIEEIMEQTMIMSEAMLKRGKLSLIGQDRHVFPVMRSSSFPHETLDAKPLLFEEHSAESRIYYAVDLGKSYVIIDQELLEASGWSKTELKEKALFNLRGLQSEPKLDTVADNDFYFISPQDGYAASRILDQSILEEYARKVSGDFCVAIPHQDVLILADLRNTRGYDILGQMAMSFYRNGDMPITPLPFEYKEGKLEPIFILAEGKPRK